MKVKINSINNTSWLVWLGFSAIISGFMFAMGLIVFFINLAYTSNQSDAYTLNLVSYYYNFILAILQIIAAIFFWVNYYYWFLSYKKAINERKKFNSTFVIIILLLLILFSFDGFVRFIYSVVGASVDYYAKEFENGNVQNLAAINYNQTGSIFGNFSEDYNALNIGNYGFNTFLLIIFSLLMTGIYLYYFFMQKKLFISEEKENAINKNSENYRKIESEKLKRKLQKHKHTDISKRVKTF